MNTKDYQELAYDMIPALRKEILTKGLDSEVHIYRDHLKMNGQLHVAISTFKGSSQKQIYTLMNDGNTCSWKFSGFVQ